jgi:hypothetical protein
MVAERLVYVEVETGNAVSLQEAEHLAYLSERRAALRDLNAQETVVDALLVQQQLMAALLYFPCSDVAARRLSIDHLTWQINHHQGRLHQLYLRWLAVAFR